MSDCIFCEEYRDGKNTFAETDLWRARWDPLPISPGHAEILPKRHEQLVAGLSPAELAEMMRFGAHVQELIRTTDLISLYDSMSEGSSSDFRVYQDRAIGALRRYGTRSPDACNFGINDGPEAGQSIGHLHMHVIPRWSGDVENPRGGVRRILGKDAYSDE